VVCAAASDGCRRAKAAGFQGRPVRLRTRDIRLAAFLLWKIDFEDESTGAADGLPNQRGKPFLSRCVWSTRIIGCPGYGGL